MKKNSTDTKSNTDMTWNHRVMRRISPDTGLPFYQIHEVFYSEEGLGWTENGIAPLGETKKELKKELKRMLDSLNKPVLNYDTGKPVKKESRKKGK